MSWYFPKQLDDWIRDQGFSEKNEGQMDQPLPQKKYDFQHKISKPPKKTCRNLPKNKKPIDFDLLQCNCLYFCVRHSTISPKPPFFLVTFFSIQNPRWRNPSRILGDWARAQVSRVHLAGLYLHQTKRAAQTDQRDEEGADPKDGAD